MNWKEKRVENISGHSFLPLLFLSIENTLPTTPGTFIGWNAVELSVPSKNAGARSAGAGGVAAKVLRTQYPALPGRHPHPQAERSRSSKTSVSLDCGSDGQSSITENRRIFFPEFSFLPILFWVWSGTEMRTPEGLTTHMHAYPGVSSVELNGTYLRVGVHQLARL